MHVDALRVLDQLPLERLGVGDVDDTRGKGKQFGKLRGAEAPRTCDDLEALGLWAYGDGLNQAVGTDGFGQLIQLALVERAAGVGGGFADGVDGDVLEFAAVLHGLALLGAWLCSEVVERRRCPASAPGRKGSSRACASGGRRPR